MPKPIPAEQWAAARAICEGAPPIQQRIAACMGVNHNTVAKKMAEEEWKIVDWREPAKVAALLGVWHGARLSEGGTTMVLSGMLDTEPAEDEIADELAEFEGMSPGELAARLVDLASRSATRILARAEKRGGVISKADADILGSIARYSDKMDAKAREYRAAEQVKGDTTHAAILGEIQERIFGLAFELADAIAAGRGGQRAQGTA